jgi:hypothetical protein
MAVKAKPKSVVMGYCVNDSREYPSDRFYEHKNIELFPKGLVPYCKDCCNTMLKYYLKKTGTLEASMWYVCARLDIPFIKRVFETVQDKNKDINKFLDNYYAYLWGCHSMKKALDTWESFADSDVSFEEISGVTKSDEGIKAQIEKLELDWGYQESEEDYKFLIYMYEKYTKGVVIENPQQEDLYRDLCLARLEKRKAEQGKIDTDITKIQSRILTLMNKLKLDEFESTKPKTVSEQLIFAKIAQIEQTKPADLYKEPTKYRDYSKLRKYMKDLVLRPVLNTLIGNKDFNLNLDDAESYNIEDE